MNYTGRPSISGCRPVLSLYPTHCFCQYLLRIFITFTNSSLFTRAFSTNSRRALRQRLSLWERSSTSPSRLRRATARVRPLRRFAPAPPEGEPLAGRVTFHWTPEARQGAKGRALLTGTAASGQRSLSSCRWPGQRSTAASEILCFARPDES